MTEKSETGQRGEQIAKEYLINKGYIIHFTNWRSGNKEVDIIAEINNLIVIVEVKSRTAPYLVEPELTVTLSKQKLLIQAANNFILFKKLNKEVRFDIISVVFYNNTHKLDHIEDAFYPKVR